MSKNPPKPRNFWTKERCREEALKYSTKKEFRAYSSSVYSKCKKHKWIDELCTHMKIVGDWYHRCVYVYEFSDNSAYVGLTYNIEDRNNRHINSKNKSSVYSHIKKTNIQPELIQLTDYIDINEARLKESEFVEIYKNNGWNILNVAKAGSVGTGIKKWTKEKCRETALLYNTKTEFRKKCGGAYDACLHRGWLDECCSHMIEQQHNWTKEECIIEASKYDNKTKFQKRSSGCYTYALRHNFLNEICVHMIELKKPSGYWTKEKCFEESLKCEKKSYFKKYCPAAYNPSLRNGWLSEFFLR